MKKFFIGIGCLITVVLFCAGGASAQNTFPQKPITVLVGFPAGGVGDILTRSISAGASKYFDHPIVIVNKPGAGGTIAADYLLRQEADGHTLMGVGMANIALGIHTTSVTWQPEDFTLILGACHYNKSFVVHSDAPYDDFNSWVEYVRKNPGYKYGTYGALTEVHLILEWVAREYGLDIVPVHFRGDAAGVSQILGKHVSGYIGAGGHVSQIKAGNLKTILQMTGEPADPNPEKVTRLKDIVSPSVTALADFPFGIVGPKGIPDSVVEKLHDAFKKAIDSQEFMKATSVANLTPTYHSPDKLAEELDEATKLIGEMIKTLGLKR